ncbi:hypothetical protein CMK11_00265 [Candidatus Poribacteria bacterium]|nr:hypothetical protein [Candidatus Poribacteria bacterium]
MARPAPTQDAPRPHVDALASLYTVRDEAEVASYLRRRPEAVDDLGEIADAVREYFPGRDVRLDVLYDPDEPLVTLYVGIQARGDIENARAQLDRFDHEWWFAKSVDMDPDLCVSLDFR